MFKVGDKVRLNKDKCDVSLANSWYNIYRHHEITDRVAAIIKIDYLGLLYFDDPPSIAMADGIILGLLNWNLK